MVEWVSVLFCCCCFCPSLVLVLFPLLPLSLYLSSSVLSLTDENVLVQVSYRESSLADGPPVSLYVSHQISFMYELLTLSTCCWAINNHISRLYLSLDHHKQIMCPSAVELARLYSIQLDAIFASP